MNTQEKEVSHVTVTGVDLPVPDTAPDQETNDSATESFATPKSIPIDTPSVDKDDLTIATLSPISDAEFENVNLNLHRAVLSFNELLRDEDTSQWYFLEKVHPNYFPNQSEYQEFLQKKGHIFFVK